MKVTGHQHYALGRLSLSAANGAKEPWTFFGRGIFVKGLIALFTI